MQTSFSLTPHKYVNTHRVTEPVCFPTLAHGFDELDDWGMPVAAQASKVDPGVPLCVPKAIGYLTERGVFDIAQLNERRDGQTGKSDDQSSALLGVHPLGWTDVTPFKWRPAGRVPLQT
jgi:hypothetical protein